MRNRIGRIHPAARYTTRAVVLAVTLLSPAAGADEPTVGVSGILPGAANPGETLEIFGQGFGTRPEDLHAWVSTADAGFDLDIFDATDTEVGGRVGAVAVADTGDLHLWKGRSYHPADRSLLVRGRVVSASRTRLFIASQRARGPVFSALTPSGGTIGSSRIGGGVRTEVLLPPAPCRPLPVRVSAVIETGEGLGEPPGPPDNPGGPLGSLAVRAIAEGGAPPAPPGPAWAVGMEVTLDTPPEDAGELATALAEILSAQLGDLGLTASADGSELTLNHPLGIQGGFLNLSF